mmetsp:Transcript_40305/g.115227  ORF Transcript_40305/g.115227 Transcript_40305/m.115227 type:complete len:264 (-) Transcript_40305:88-879(-)
MAFFINDMELTSLGYGLLLGAVGGGLSSFGLSILASIACTVRSAKEMLGESGDFAQATLLRKHISPDTKAADIAPQQPQQSAVYHKPFFLISYVFDAVRASDGVTCRVEVRDRKVPSFVWEQLKEQSTVTIRFMKDEPRRCRVVAALEHEQRGFMAFRARSSVALVLAALGLAAAILSLVDHHLAGGILYAALVIASLFWQFTGRRAMQACLPCCRAHLQKPWSPLWMHRGCVFCQELGKDVEPSFEPKPLLPQDVEIHAFGG